MAKSTIWVWIRVPLRAIEAAIGALKDRAMQRHQEDQRTEADQDDADAEDLKTGVRGLEDPPTQFHWPRDNGGK